MKKKRGRLHLLSWNNWFWFLAFEHCAPQSLILRRKKTSGKNIFNIYNSKTGSEFFEVKGNKLVMSVVDSYICFTCCVSASVL